jgi:3-deoxy-D-manno-octulosonic-acid transferase
VVVDSVGQLAHLYTIGDVAFVGGGFHDEGLHSVLEPAAAGIPIVIGPRHRNARAAGDLVRIGGAKIALNDAEMGRAFAGWLADGEARAAAGAGARGYIDGHRGAAARTAELLKTLIE